MHDPLPAAAGATAAAEKGLVAWLAGCAALPVSYPAVFAVAPRALRSSARFRSRWGPSRSETFCFFSVVLQWRCQRDASPRDSVFPALAAVAAAVQASGLAAWLAAVFAAVPAAASYPPRVRIMKSAKFSKICNKHFTKFADMLRSERCKGMHIL